MRAHDIKSLLRYGKAFLKERNTEAYSLCAELLLAHATGLDRVRILTDTEYIADAACAGEYFKLLDRCAENEPVQYITGKCEFMSLDFFVSPAVLIPRPDTETLVEEALGVIPRDARVLELGTGSGCIVVSLAKYAPGIKVTAADISPEALRIAKKNASNNGVSDNIEFMLADIRDMDLPKIFDAVVSNPPYIRTEDIAGLGRNVRDYEPHLALDGGGDGLEFFRVISHKAKHMLKPGGALIFETGAEQTFDVREILLHAGYSDIRTKKDLSGLDRVTCAKL